MSNAEGRLSQAAVDLLVVVAETPSLAISGTALGTFHADAGAELIAVGALQPDGFEPVTVSLADHDDAAVSVSWNSKTGRHEYFSPAVGMVPVEDDVLRLFRLQIPWLLGWIAGHLGFSAGGRHVDLVPDRLWDLGDVWLGERKSDKRRTAIYFARRIGEPGARTSVLEALRSRAGRPPGVILTSSPTVELGNPAMTGGCSIVPIRTCARAGGSGFTFDAGIIRVAVHGLRPIRAGSPVQVDAEFRVVRVGEREFRFRGDKQRQVVEHLYGVWDRKEGRVSAALMFSELDFPDATRLRDLFKGHSDWKDLIGYEDGACWLKCDELLTSDTVTSD